MGDARDLESVCMCQERTENRNRITWGAVVLFMRRKAYFFKCPYTRVYNIPFDMKVCICVGTPEERG